MKAIIEQQIEVLQSLNLAVLTGKEINAINGAINRLSVLIDNPITNEYPIMDCSPKALALISNKESLLTGTTEQLGINGKYPFGQLLIGQSFTMRYSEGRTRGCIESCQRAYADRTGKSFRVLSHAQLGLFEVVRLS
jgi:hypothetical protein